MSDPAHFHPHLSQVPKVDRKYKYFPSYIPDYTVLQPFSTLFSGPGEMPNQHSQVIERIALLGIAPCPLMHCCLVHNAF